ncbi:MAG: mechanosensitive ion channel [Gemmatimonadetes bacterium]|nr:mechanosensitive ion channel [Gemmatimonadota bacterium]
MSAGLAALAWALPAALQVLVPQVQPGPDDSGVLAIPPLPDTTQRNLLISAVVIVLILLARRAIVAFIGRHVESQPLRYRWSKSTTYAGFLVGVLVLLQVWFTAIQSLGTFLGLLSAGLAIALKDLVADLAGWFFILWRRQPGTPLPQAGPRVLLRGPRVRGRDARVPPPHHLGTGRRPGRRRRVSWSRRRVGQPRVPR